MTDRRVLMVALDGLEISVLRRAMASGRLPNLKAYAEAATELAVQSDGERLEGTVWPTFTTGTPPGYHGHHWFFQWVPEQGRFIDTADERFAVTPFWKAATSVGKRVTVFDLPYTLPTGDASERLLTGWGVQDEMAQHANPPSFKREIIKKHGRSKVEKDTLLVQTPEDRLKLARRMRAGARQRARVLVDLAGRRDWDVMLFAFGEYHLSGHHLSMPMQLSPKVDNEAALIGIVQPVDDAWPDIVKAAGDDCDIFLFALHGMQPKVAYAEAVQHVLEEMQGKPQAGPPKDDLLRRARNLMPESVHRAIWLRLPASMRLQRMIQAWMARMDVERDPVFVLEGDCAVALRVNVQGRDKYGVVPPSETRAMLDRVFAEVGRYTTPEGELPFVDMVVSSEVFPGPRSELLPDGMLIYNPAVRALREMTRDDGFKVELVNPTSRNGIHTGKGFAFYRPGRSTTVKRDEIDNLDFAPTVLQMAGVEPGPDLHGDPFL
ncbi:MAG TPA: alkaline phosphatase family protein [Tepidiformaceae bacterium]|nr:alkaline phosphatase family protein [Tepidiformaceae bacterium]